MDNIVKSNEEAVWDMLEKHIEGNLSEIEKDKLILALCGSIEELRKVLNWYGEGNHMVSTWYAREDVELCNHVENSSSWRSFHTEDRDYIENGERAEDAAYKAEMPEQIIEKLTNTLTKKVNTMSNLNTNTIETQAEQTALNYTLNKEDFVQAVSDFKLFSKDKDNGPWKNSDGTKFKGNMRFSTYIFYAMLRNKNVDKVTHSVESETFRDRIDALKSMAGLSNSYVSYEVREEMALISKCFSSLSEDQIKSVIKGYFA